MNVNVLKRILAAINRTNNLVDITNVHAEDLPDCDILTYSFPCQDLSVAGFWHHNTGGIDRDAHNRSSLLWQIERLLTEYAESDKDLPNFLLMENVSAILSPKHIGNFNEWCGFLEYLGYVNQIYTLNSRDFGIPQSRERTYMLSVRAITQKQKEKINNFFAENNLENRTSAKLKPIKHYLRLDYTDERYRKEAIESTPHFTESRRKIFNHNPVLAVDDKAFDDACARTVTTKQDRNPNSGIIEYKKNPLVPWNTHYRNLTPRECFLLMGFNESSFDALIENNINIRKNTQFLPVSKLGKLAGNSIVVPVLEEIFKQVIELNEMI